MGATTVVVSASAGAEAGEGQEARGETMVAGARGCASREGAKGGAEERAPLPPPLPRGGRWRGEGSRSRPPCALLVSLSFFSPATVLFYSAPLSPLSAPLPSPPRKNSRGPSKTLTLPYE